MAEQPGVVPWRRRLAAAAALAALAFALLVLVTGVFDRWQSFAVALLALASAVVGGWYALTRRGPLRVAGASAAVVGLVVFVLVMVASGSVGVLVAAGLLGVGSVLSAEVALAPAVAHRDPLPAAPRPRHPVLLLNPRSGGGKAEQNDLADRCRERGIEPVVLDPGVDLLAEAEAAVARGADCLGMAGGDGSQALVAGVAARHGLPHVVVPAGTRNHFALDLGLDRDDVVGALDAFVDGVDRVVDLGEVNGRVFVNNASLGVYAAIVRAAEYRDAKVATAASLLPDLIGPDATPPDLRFTLPSGDQVSRPQLVLVSNNPYQLRRLRGAGSRERLDGGVLGVVAVSVRGVRDAEELAVLEASGQVQRFAGWHEMTTTALEVHSGAPVEVGMDGEALTIAPPLQFRVRPAALRVRVPRAVAARPRPEPVRITSRSTVAQLWLVLRGREAGPPR
jgi:diacylglycerol kinase family enzyme